jgi:hypothetical protein
VFLIRRRQVPRQPGAVTPPLFLYCTFIVAGSLHRHWQTFVPQAANGLVGCHAPCSSSSFVTAAPVSFAALHSSTPHYRSISPCSPSAHLVPFRSFVVPSFQYCSVHPLPIICSPALPTSAAFAKCCPTHNALAHGSFVPHFAMQH